MQSLYFIIFNSYDFGERRIDNPYRKERGEGVFWEGAGTKKWVANFLQYKLVVREQVCLFIEKYGISQLLQSVMSKMW
jgi:hypothetical protein